MLCKKDVAGFIVNRIFIPLVHEAVYCQERDNVPMTTIDSAVKFKLSFPMGIFELADYSGLDVIHKATVEMYSRDKKVIRPHPKIKQLFDEKNLGQKSGKGFYEYKSDKYERINLTEQEAGRVQSNCSDRSSCQQCGVAYFKRCVQQGRFGKGAQAWHGVEKGAVHHSTRIWGQKYRSQSARLGCKIWAVLWS